jgi:hypothetical protein
VQEKTKPRGEHPCPRAFDSPGLDVPEVHFVRPTLAAGLNFRRALRFPLPRLCPMGRHKFDKNDFEKWYARTIKNKECLMGHRVYAWPINDVKMCANGHWNSNGTGAARLAPTATSAISSLTRSSTRRVVHARMRIMNGTLR